MSEDDKRPTKRDPFAPLPLAESLTGKTDTKPTDKGMMAPPPRPAEMFTGVEAAADVPTLEPDADIDTDARTAELPAIPPKTDDAPASASAPVALKDGDDNVFSFAAKPERAPKRSKRVRADSEADDDDDDRPRKRRAGVAVAALALVVGGGIAATVLLGRVNSGRYAIVCTADKAVVEQGRVFPPWGTRPMLGGEWVPLELPPEAPCNPRETENQAEVASWFEKMLEDRAATLLTAREVSAVDQAEGVLKQALLVARSLPTDDERIDTRERIERMLGDVAYWRASARLKAASEALADAAKQFDAAALQKPRYVTDAAAWATYARKLATDLSLGPAGAEKSAAFPPAPPSERPGVPVGTELPVEPGQATGSGDAPAAPPAAAPSTAPSGGVLL